MRSPSQKVIISCCQYATTYINSTHPPPPSSLNDRSLLFYHTTHARTHTTYICITINRKEMNSVLQIVDSPGRRAVRTYKCVRVGDDDKHKKVISRWWIIIRAHVQLSQHTRATPRDVKDLDVRMLYMLLFRWWLLAFYFLFAISARRTQSTHSHTRMGTHHTHQNYATHFVCYYHSLLCKKTFERMSVGGCYVLCYILLGLCLCAAKT